MIKRVLQDEAIGGLDSGGRPGSIPYKPKQNHWESIVDETERRRTGMKMKMDDNSDDVLLSFRRTSCERSAARVASGAPGKSGTDHRS